MASTGGGNQLKTYLDYLESVAQDDVKALHEAERHYGDSWKKRGGVGAFMMMARKWDRLEKQVSRHATAPETDLHSAPYDIFAHLEVDDRIEGILDDLHDLRRYCILIEAEVRARANAITDVPTGEHVGPTEDGDTPGMGRLEAHSD